MRLLTLVFLVLSTTAASAAERDLVLVRNRAEVQSAFSPETKLRVVNLWATWCVPCVAEMPDLQAIDQDFRDRDVEIIGVSLDDAIPGKREDRQALVRRFLEKKKINFKIAYYVGNTARLADEYDYDAEIPITLVFDKSGKELLRHQGVINRDEFSGRLRALLKTN